MGAPAEPASGSGPLIVIFSVCPWIAPLPEPWDVTVPVGETLTIEPGVVVQFAATDDQAGGRDASRSELSVAGALVAVGSVGAPVTFTGAAGSWRGVRLEAGSTGSALADVVIANAVNGLDVATAGANTFSSISVMGATGYGVRLSAGSHVFDGLSITGGAGDGPLGGLHRALAALGC